MVKFDFDLDPEWLYYKLLSDGYRAAEPLHYRKGKYGLTAVVALHKHQVPDCFPDVVYDMLEHKRYVLNIIEDMLNGKCIIELENGYLGRA